MVQAKKKICECGSTEIKVEQGNWLKVVHCKKCKEMLDSGIAGMETITESIVRNQKAPTKIAAVIGKLEDKNEKT